MDHPPCPNQLVLSDNSNKNSEDQPGPFHSEAHAPIPSNDEENQEYGCKYCTKKFSNKQALGGHQNAHKAERALEKATREVQDYHSGSHGSNGVVNLGKGSYLASYHRSHDFFGRSVYNNFPYYAQQHGLGMCDNARPGLPFAGNPYATTQPLTRLGAPTIPRQGAFDGQNAGVNVQFPNIGAADAGSSSRPVYPHLSDFVAPIGRNRNSMNDPGIDQQDEDDPGLDLSLKL